MVLVHTELCPNAVPAPQAEGGEQVEHDVGIKIVVTDPTDHRLVDTVTSEEVGEDAFHKPSPFFLLQGRFAFHSHVSGLHKICFSLNISHWFAGHQKLVRNCFFFFRCIIRLQRMDLELKINEKEIPTETIPKKEHVSSNLTEDVQFFRSHPFFAPDIEVKILKIAEKIRAIQHDVQYFKDQEATFRDTSESINFRSLWFSIFQIGAMLILSLMQALFSFF